MTQVNWIRRYELAQFFALNRRLCKDWTVFLPRRLFVVWDVFLTFTDACDGRVVPPIVFHCMHNMIYSHNIIWHICTCLTVMLRLGYQCILEISDWICYLCLAVTVVYLSPFLTFSTSVTPLLFPFLPCSIFPLFSNPYGELPSLIFWLDLTSNSFLLFLLSLSLDHTLGLKT